MNNEDIEKIKLKCRVCCDEYIIQEQLLDNSIEKNDTQVIDYIKKVVMPSLVSEYAQLNADLIIYTTKQFDPYKN